MSNSKDSDKTVILHSPPPGADPTRTVVIPTPGARRPQPGGPGPQTHFQPPPGPAAYPPIGGGEPFRLNQGLNPLVSAASTLLTVIIKLRSTLQHNDIPGLHRQLANEIRSFEQQAKNSGSPPEIVLSARYLLCSVIDEIVINTPWGAACGWDHRSLLSLFHNETFGGEKCFVILQRMLATPAKNLDILELFYICLSLGFEGQYRLDTRGHAQLAQIQDHLYQTIENHRGHFEPDLSSSWQSGVKRKTNLIHYVPLWVVASCALVVLLVVYSGFRVWLYQSTSDTTAALTALTREDK